jgi:hypothetical protein
MNITQSFARHLIFAVRNPLSGIAQRSTMPLHENQRLTAA